MQHQTHLTRAACLHCIIEAPSAIFIAGKFDKENRGDHQPTLLRSHWYWFDWLAIEHCSRTLLRAPVCPQSHQSGWQFIRPMIVTTFLVPLALLSSRWDSHDIILMISLIAIQILFLRAGKAGSLIIWVRNNSIRL